jgi:predicted SnoaL-like aldol condensation-catalyzing enzyme
MSTEENKALVRRLVEEVWNQGNLAIFDELYAPDFIFHDPGLPHVRTREEDKQWIAGILKAFPDFHITIDDLITEGDQVVVRLTGRGTNTGDILAPAPHPATGKQVTITGNVIVRIANGHFVEIWHQVDWLGLFQQLGLIPALAQAG